MPCLRPQTGWQPRGGITVAARWAGICAIEAAHGRHGKRRQRGTPSSRLPGCGCCSDSGGDTPGELGERRRPSRGWPHLSAKNAGRAAGPYPLRRGRLRTARQGLPSLRAWDGVIPEAERGRTPPCPVRSAYAFAGFPRCRAAPDRRASVPRRADCPRDNRCRARRDCSAPTGRRAA